MPGEQHRGPAVVFHWAEVGWRGRRREGAEELVGGADADEVEAYDAGNVANRPWDTLAVVEKHCLRRGVSMAQVALPGVRDRRLFVGVRSTQDRYPIGATSEASPSPSPRKRTRLDEVSALPAYPLTHTA